MDGFPIMTGAKQTARPAADIWVDADEWDEAAIPPRPWIAPGYALRGAVTLVAGPPSALKSSTLLGWAAAIVLGQSFGRFRPSVSGNVLVYNVEDDQNEQRRRLSATLRQFNATPGDIRGQLHRIGPEAVGTLLERDDIGNIRFTGAMGRLVELIEDRRPVMLIVDPLAELHTAEENDNTSLRLVVAKFRALAVQFDMAVVIAHHMRKGGGMSPGDPDAARGASAIIGAVRVAVTLITMSEADAEAYGMPTDIEARSRYVRMDDAKSNYAPLQRAQWFEKVAYELDNGDTVAAAVPWMPPEEKQASLSDLHALAAGIERGSPVGEPWSPKLSKDVRSVKALLVEHGFTTQPAQQIAIAKLMQDHGLAAGSYKNPRNRKRTSGLRIGSKPPAAWFSDDAEEEPP